jgi:hypothetical protein
VTRCEGKRLHRHAAACPTTQHEHCGNHVVPYRTGSVENIATLRLHTHTHTRARARAIMAFLRGITQPRSLASPECRIPSTTPYLRRSSACHAARCPLCVSEALAASLVRRGRRVTRPAWWDDSPDVEQGERATHGALAARVGHAGTARTRLSSEHAVTLVKRWCGGESGDGGVTRHTAHRTSKTRRRSHRRECL